MVGTEETETGQGVRRVATFYRDHAVLVFGSAPIESTAALLVTLVNGAASTAGILLLGQVVGTAVSTTDAGRAMTWVLWLGIAFVVTAISGGVLEVLSQRIMSRSVARVTRLTAELGYAPAGISHLEDPEEAGRLQTLVKAIHEWTYLEGIASTWGVIGIRLGGVGAFAVMAAWHWWAAIALAAGYIISGRALTAWLLSIFSDMALDPPLDRRRSQYVFSLLMEGKAAKEIRLFGLSGWLIGRYRQLWQAAMSGVWERRNATLGPIFATTAVLTASAFLVYGQMGREAWSGALPVSQLTALVGASVAMWALGMLGDNQVLFTQSMATTARLRQAREQIGLPGLSPGPERAPDPQPERAHEPAGIEIRDLHFTYPARTEPVFHGLQLTVPAGQSIAVVGVNGAGKSTLIKLLCGLYSPDSGQVLVGGGDPARDARARRRVAVIFQEFVRYHLSLRENVALGSRGSPDTDPAVRQAVHDAGAEDIVAGLDEGWETVLSGEYAGGTDLSGGQWQRIALARALAAIAGGSGVLVLDEPTAALDVRAEAQLFDRFLEVTRGMTTVLVSHRLSSVRHADRIVVIDHGRIIEDGSHAELMARGGPYSRMFTLQASRFAAASGDGVVPR
ncbi:MAG TPA: ABC transporter ATP-binding protein [Mycobacteriales bacterium]|nr:ABC transporter ATP-binding protein [Mycobacteriales bacterium]